jgi:hypothetical protein
VLNVPATDDASAFANFELLPEDKTRKVLHGPDGQPSTARIAGLKTHRMKFWCELKLEPKVHVSSFKPEKASVARMKRSRSPPLMGREQGYVRFDPPTPHGNTESLKMVTGPAGTYGVS